MGFARLLARGTIGALMVGHGAQKLFGWFGGHGPDGTGQFFEQIGFRPGSSTRSRPGRPRPAAGRCSRSGSRRRRPRPRSPG